MREGFGVVLAEALAAGADEVGDGGGDLEFVLQQAEVSGGEVEVAAFVPEVDLFGLAGDVAFAVFYFGDFDG